MSPPPGLMFVSSLYPQLALWATNISLAWPTGRPELPSKEFDWLIVLRVKTSLKWDSSTAVYRMEKHTELEWRKGRTDMYCPSCGIQLAQALSYCNRCGANLAPLKDLSTTITPSAPLHDTVAQPRTLNSLIWAIVVTTIIVLGMGLGALVLMRDGSIDQGLGRIFVILCFVTLPIIEGLLVWQLISSNRRVKRLTSQVQENASAPDQLSATTARSLSEPTETMPSVTEHTTRAFEHSYRGRERS